MTPPSPTPHPDVRTTLRAIERAAFVAARALDEGDRETARKAIETIRERAARLP